jgi:hypothetical protein
MQLYIEKWDYKYPKICMYVQQFKDGVYIDGNVGKEEN